MTGPNGGEIGPDLSNGIWGYPFPSGNPSWWTSQSSWAQENFDNVNQLSTTNNNNTHLVDNILIANPYVRAAKAQFAFKTPPGVSIKVSGMPTKGSNTSTFVMKKGYVGRLTVKIQTTKKFTIYRKRMHKPIYAELMTLINGHEAGGVTYGLTAGRSPTGSK